jgi:predicted flavoprotein YhiN
MPQRLAQAMVERLGLTGNLADQPDARLGEIAKAVQAWPFRPTATEGYRTAEVTLGGIDTTGLSSTTMEAKDVPGLFAIGEAVDVTGWLGGYNFQWAWSSGWAAGQAIAGRAAS